MARDRTLASIAVLLSAAALLAPAARAQSSGLDPDTEVARRHFREGAKYYLQEDYLHALKEFEAAREARPFPAFDFNIARCYDRLERYPEAIEAYGRFLAGATSPQDRADIPEAAERVRTLKERLKARAAEERSAARTASPPPAASPLQSSDEAEAPAEPDRAAPRRRPWAPLVVGVGALGLFGSGLGLYLSARSDYDAQVPSCTPRCAPAILDPIESRADAGYALLAIGGAALAVDVALWIWYGAGRRADGRAGTTLFVAPTGPGVMAGGSF